MERGGYTSAAREALHAALERLRVDPEQADQYELANADMQFHDLLTRESEHQVLLEVLDSLRLQMRQFIVYTKLMGSDEEPEQVTHGRLLDAVESDDPDRAAQAVHAHILEAGKLLLSKLEAEDDVDRSGSNTRIQPVRTAASNRLRHRRPGDVGLEDSARTRSDRG